ncbi:hypothetical protein [Falsiroseomonas sp.]|uniref:hypothetical protein n=1 Tax=Falsiroseomonas sp. TaxID=2870721 RepID=UPI002735B0B8|nr:hypothetical protein [Falsiroseomonas sp.]MDP3417890.1 hypothetical protein [Falsiroseomonas sp.]
MSAPDRAAWPPSWHAIAAAVQKAAKEGRPLVNRIDVARATGRQAGATMDDVDAMIAAGALIGERQRGTAGPSRHRVADSLEWTAWPSPTPLQVLVAEEDGLVLGALRSAIASGTRVVSLREFVRAAGIPEDRTRRVTTRLLVRTIEREVREVSPPEFRFRIIGTEMVTPWVPMLYADGVKRVPKPATTGSLGLSGRGKFLHPVQQARRDESRRIQNHQRRMTAAVRQSEEELNALVAEHMRRHGVTFIRPTHDGGPAPAPVGSRGGMMSISDGVSMARRL